MLTENYWKLSFATGMFLLTTQFTMDSHSKKEKAAFQIWCIWCRKCFSSCGIVIMASAKWIKNWANLSYLCLIFITIKGVIDYVCPHWPCGSCFSKACGTNLSSQQTPHASPYNSTVLDSEDQHLLKCGLNIGQKVCLPFHNTQASTIRSQPAQATGTRDRTRAQISLVQDQHSIGLSECWILNPKSC